MNIFCRLFGHTWVHQSEDPKISWNTGKSLSELHLTVDGEYKFWLECQRCHDRNDAPSSSDVKGANN
ncbi:MAG: hypothetical protein ACI8QZ_001636 [Chlamydiales bacterium]|jgi:hypothetical protein